MNNIFIQEACVEVRPAKDGEEERIRYYDGDVYETRFKATAPLFKHCQKEHGRCISRVYIDTKDGKAKAIGWVFRKRDKYTDCDKTFIRETWVTLHKKEPKHIHKVKYCYKELA